MENVSNEKILLFFSLKILFSNVHNVHISLFFFLNQIFSVLVFNICFAPEKKKTLLSKLNCLLFSASDIRLHAVTDPGDCLHTLSGMKIK